MIALRFFSKIIFSIMLGLGLALAWFQFDDRFVTTANRAMENYFEHNLNCRFSGRVKRLRPFSLTLEFEDVMVSPLGTQQGWHWSARTMVLELSLRHYLYHRSFGLTVSLKGVCSSSCVENSNATAGNLIKQSPSLPAYVARNFAEACSVPNPAKTYRKNWRTR